MSEVLPEDAVAAAKAIALKLTATASAPGDDPSLGVAGDPAIVAAAPASESGRLFACTSRQVTLACTLFSGPRACWDSEEVSCWRDSKSLPAFLLAGCSCPIHALNIYRLGAASVTNLDV